jgi:hypothetical protein
LRGGRRIALKSQECLVDSQLCIAFGLLVTECARRGIGRTTAFRLAREKKVATFLIGRRRYVTIASLNALAYQREEANHEA